MKYTHLLAAAGIVTVLAVAMTRLHAQSTPTGLTVHPSNFELTAQGDQPITQAVYLINSSTQAIPVTVNLRNFTAQGEEGEVSLTDEATSYSLASWITVTPKSTTIQPKETQKFTFTISPPQGAEPGGHFGSIVFSSIPQKNLTQTGAALSQEVASLILLRVPGDVREQALVESFTTDKSFYQEGPVNFMTRIKNTGGVHIRPQGEIVLTDMLGKKINVPFDSRNVLPNAVRKMATTWNQKFLLGKYKADLLTAYGSKNQQLSATTYFYAFPLQYAVVILVVLVLVILLRKRLLRAFKALFTGK